MRATPVGGTGSGTSYGCPCGQHVGYAATTTEAIAAVRSCPGPPTDRPGRTKPAWLAARKRAAPPERTP